jgi:rubrerythrin
MVFPKRIRRLQRQSILSNPTKEGKNMSENAALDALKNAILLERRGRAFYRKVAEHTASDAVKRFFNLMAEEETQHEQMLARQFKNTREGRRFDADDWKPEETGSAAATVLSEEIRQQISAATYEAAAIAAAMAMEKDAIDFYSRRAAETPDAVEKRLYQWLADWERTHLDFLARIDRDLTEKIWQDNQFWPF